MKFRVLLFSSILAVLSLSVSGVAQNDKQQSQSSPQTQVQAQPATAQSQPAAQGQSQPVAQDQSASDQSDQSQPADKNDKKDKNKKDKKEKKYPHDGGKDDVSAIGNRHVGGIDWYSTETDIKIGKTYAQQIEQSMKFITDPVITEYVNRIGQNLVRNSDAKVPFTIKVVDSDEINAMALPGGFFYVNSGLILAADNEAELAGVMSHEIAHVALRHGTRGQTRADIANIMSIPLIFVGGGIGYAARQVAGIGLPMTFLKFSRGFEAEADYFGLQYMYKAGYDPNQFVNFFEKVQAQEKKKPGSLAKAFATHPQTPDRIEKTQEEIATILPPRNEYIENTSEFNDVKARLAAIENRHKVQDDHNPNKPTLRRTANTSDDGDKKDDGRPTLKRRDN